LDVTAITLYGVVALTFMMVMYSLETRGRGYLLAFCLGCALSSVYGFLSSAWPFGVVEAIWLEWPSAAIPPGPERTNERRVRR
jgi:hypothetical protein